MQDPPDCHMGNPDMTGDSPRTGTGIVLHQTKHSLHIVWRSYSSLTFLCVHDEGSAVGQFLVQACKEGVAGSLPPGQRWAHNRCAARPLQSAARCISASSAFV
ncbi:hypothetical protein AVEN_132036-1 [Araneus ventricosus]|uniref:Uncharacterized protein n=1 Tax=Araneus ventricosus TaxID=182803 RepID=A0A4Y2NFJ7_ARAVE|nr:hypothetical protein AVEN_132036-1 [Araneus ventricosus]